MEKMTARRAFLGAGVVLATVGAAGVGRSQPRESSSTGGMGLKECAQDCVASHTACMETVQHCLVRGGPHAAASHIAVLLDCAEMCQVTANSLLRGSPQHAILCDACARLCDACVRECRSFADDVSMQRCAGICQKCAESCRHMAMMAH